ncbi:MAG: T9SS type A sorting domain-containing protein [Bacteroidales bacterium]|jgi:hypothetical protein
MKKLYILIMFLAFSLPAIKALAQCDSMLFHDGSMESQWGSSANNDQFSIFVRFTPSYYPAQLCAIRAYFRNGSTGSRCKWRVYSDPAGAKHGGVSQIYLGSTAFANPSAGGVTGQTYEIYSGDLTSHNIQITSGDMYVGVTQDSAWFGLAIDNSPLDSVADDNHQWIDNIGSWSTLYHSAANGQFGITAFFRTTVGIQETNSNESNIMVYPNPATNDITIESSPAVIELFDIQGQLIKTLAATDNKTDIDVSAFTNGVYILKVRTYKGIEVRKFIKE